MSLSQGSFYPSQSPFHVHFDHSLRNLPYTGGPRVVSLDQLEGQLEVVAVEVEEEEKMHEVVKVVKELAHVNYCSIAIHNFPSPASREVKT